MKKILLTLLFLILGNDIFGTSIMFPEFNLYTELNDSLKTKTSYRIDMVVDTGIKYGVAIGIGLKGYNLTTLNSNVLRLDKLTLDTEPFNLFHLGFFFGKNRTLGINDLGYQGFQYHQADNIEYIGYKDINGTGFELYRGFWDDMFEPHLYFYTSDPLISTSTNNLANLDTVLIFQMDNYKIEGYFGVNYDPEQLWNKHFGLTISTKYSKIDFLLSLFSPDNPMLESLIADNLYINVTEHLVSGLFEQTLSVFSRPRYYNEFEETLTNDYDVYLQLGVVIDNFGAGVENTLRYADNYDLSDQIAAYTYFIMNNIKYKVGGYYTIPVIASDAENYKGSAFTSSYGIFFNVSGSM